MLGLLKAEIITGTVGFVYRTGLALMGLRHGLAEAMGDRQVALLAGKQGGEHWG